MHQDTGRAGPRPGLPFLIVHRPIRVQIIFMMAVRSHERRPWGHTTIATATTYKTALKVVVLVPAVNRPPQLGDKYMSTGQGDQQRTSTHLYLSPGTQHSLSLHFNSINTDYFVHAGR
ncbi:hypothetical protein OTU49_000435 [Cherax quadricarinatus]|uniref:Uncharacterized protein n=1 Tax=Cherax quadricarinatus TaxID=27406 RepID=A0AAW0XKR0_CHEQU